MAAGMPAGIPHRHVIVAVDESDVGEWLAWALMTLTYLVLNVISPHAPYTLTFMARLLPRLLTGPLRTFTVKVTW
jgi:hypothetical protein